MHFNGSRKCPKTPLNSRRCICVPGSKIWYLQSHIVLQTYLTPSLFNPRNSEENPRLDWNMVWTRTYLRSTTMVTQFPHYKKWAVNAISKTHYEPHRLQAKLRVKAENHAKVGLLKFESLIELHIGKDLEKDSRLYYIHCLKAKFNHSVRIVFRISTYFGIVLSGIWSRQYFIQRATRKK